LEDLGHGFIKMLHQKSVDRIQIEEKALKDKKKYLAWSELSLNRKLIQGFIKVY
jgi:membrane-bound lytic murein transglycosylase